MDTTKKILVPVQTKCVGCGELIRQGAPGTWVRDRGVFHEACWAKTSGSNPSGAA